MFDQGHLQPYNFAPRQPEPPRKKPVGLWIVLSVLALVLVGSATWLVVETTGQAPQTPAASSELDTETATVTASDGRSQLTVPAKWGDLPEQFKVSGTVIGRGQIFQERYLLLVTDDKAKFKDFADFEETAQISMANVTVGLSVDTTVAGLPAIRFEATGTFDGHDIVYWCTLIDGARGYHQIITWTLADRRAEGEPALRKIVESFREI